MRLLRSRQSTWMYGFPTRKHHYAERSLAKRHNGADLKFADHLNLSSPYRTSSNLTCNGNRNVSSSVKSLDKHDLTETLPGLSAYQFHNRSNCVIPLSNSVAGRYVTFGDELSAEHDISNYYCGNPTGWCKYESLNRDGDRLAYSSPNVQNISSEMHTIVPHRHVPPLIRSPTHYPETPPSASRTNSLFACTKARLEWSERNSVAQSSCIKTTSSPATLVGNISSLLPNEQRTTETLLLKAVKLEDTTILADLLNEDWNEDVNEVDVTGRTVLSYLVMKNNVTLLLEKLLKAPELDVNKSDNEGNTPLHFSAQAGQVEALNLLLNTCSAVEIDARNIFGFTPLMKAALQGRTKCVKLLLFAGASPTMRDTGRGLRAEQWARYCGRYICADVIEKYARNQLLSKTASYGNWGAQSEIGLQIVNGKLQPSTIVLRNAISQNYKNSSIKSRLKRAFLHTHPSNWNSSNNSKVNSYSLVTQLTSAALCVSSPVLPNSGKISPVVKSLMKPFVIPRVEITNIPDSDLPKDSLKLSDDDSSRKMSTEQDPNGAKKGRKLSCFVKLRKRVTS